MYQWYGYPDWWYQWYQSQVPQRKATPIHINCPKDITDGGKEQMMASYEAAHRMFVNLCPKGARVQKVIGIRGTNRYKCAWRVHYIRDGVPGVNDQRLLLNILNSKPQNIQLIEEPHSFPPDCKPLELDYSVGFCGCAVSRNPIRVLEYGTKNNLYNFQGIASRLIHINCPRDADGGIEQMEAIHAAAYRMFVDLCPEGLRVQNVTGIRGKKRYKCAWRVVYVRDGVHGISDQDLLRNIYIRHPQNTEVIKLPRHLPRDVKLLEVDYSMWCDCAVSHVPCNL